MDSKFWVANASPLILLSKAKSLYILPSLLESVIIPSAVTREIGAKKEGVSLLEEIKKHDKFLIKGDIDVPNDILAWDLGVGETQVLVYGKRYGADRVILDDLEGRRCAKVIGVATIGTLGLVARAKKLGALDQARPVIEQLCQHGLYATTDLLNWIFNEVGE